MVRPKIRENVLFSLWAVAQGLRTTDYGLPSLYEPYEPHEPFKHSPSNRSPL